MELYQKFSSGMLKYRVTFNGVLYELWHYKDVMVRFISK